MPHHVMPDAVVAALLALACPGATVNRVATINAGVVVNTVHSNVTVTANTVAASASCSQRHCGQHRLDQDCCNQ